MARPDAERVWLAFAQSALAGAMAINAEIDPHETTWSKYNASVADDCASIADEMLDRWRLRYGDERLPLPRPPIPGVEPPPPSGKKPPSMIPAADRDGVNW